MVIQNIVFCTNFVGTGRAPSVYTHLLLSTNYTNLHEFFSCWLGFLLMNCWWTNWKKSNNLFPIKWIFVKKFVLIRVIRGQKNWIAPCFEPRSRNDVALCGFISRYLLLFELFYHHTHSGGQGRISNPICAICHAPISELQKYFNSKEKAVQRVICNAG